MRKNLQYKALGSVFLMLVMIMFIPVFVSGELKETDTIKAYDKVNQQITLINKTDLTLNIATIKLNTPLHNIIYQLGYVSVAEIEITNNIEIEYLLNEMKSYDRKKNDLEVNVKYDYKKKVNKSSTFINYLGKEEVYYYDDWEIIDLKSIKLKKGEKIIISLWTNVKNGDYIEWIPTMYSRELNEFASYEGVGGTKTYYEEGGINYTVHVYTSAGTFNWTGDSKNVTILMIGGGGGGSAGGGGAGGLYYNSSFLMSAGFHNITIGEGGQPKDGVNGYNGTNTTFDGTVLVAWGGGGGGESDKAGYKGGSGGGAGLSGAPPKYGGNVSDITQGKVGGNTTYAATGYPAGGGGGCGAAGGNAYNVTAAGDGGVGCTYNITNGTDIYYAGGGGGALGAAGGSNYYGKGGLGGGGNGAVTTGTATSGVNGTGGGGGGKDNGATAGRGGDGLVIIRYLTDTGETPASGNPSVVLDNPSNYYNTTNPTILFNTTVTDLNPAGTIKNVTLYIDGVLNETNATEGVNLTYTFAKILSQGNHNWSILAYNNNSKANQSSTREFIVDFTSPVIVITYPTNTTYMEDIVTTTSKTIWFNWTSSDLNLDKCWWSKDKGATNTTITCNSNTSYSSVYGIENFTAWSNDTLGNLNVGRIVATFGYKILENSRNFSAVAYESSTETYSINLTANASLTNVYLDYNGSALATQKYGNIWNVSKILNDSDVGNNTINWILTYAGTNYTTSNSYQEVISVGLSICGGAFTVPYLNISFRDESNNSLIKAKIPYAYFYYGDGTTNKTYEFTNNTENNNYAFCFAPANRTIYISYYIQYSGTNYPQRVYNPEAALFSNETTNKTLYLLYSSSGLYVTFQTLDSSDSPISGVNVNATRNILGTDEIVAEGTTGSDGGVTFWLNPDFLHTIHFSATGYNDYVSSIFPTQSLYTIQLGGETPISTDYTRGVNIWITPTATELYNNTIYNFSARLKSTYWDVSDWGFNIKNTTGFYYYNVSASTNGGMLQTNINSTNNQTFVMQFYYKINGTYTNYTYNWNVLNTLGDDWSIKHFGQDLKTYLEGGIFGLTNFGLAIILFFIIILVTGVVSYKFGFTSPAAIIGVVFGIVFILDYGLNLMENLNPIGAISHAPTIFVGLVLVIFIIREIISQ